MVAEEGKRSKPTENEQLDTMLLFFDLAPLSTEEGPFFLPVADCDSPTAVERAFFERGTRPATCGFFVEGWQGLEVSKQCQESELANKRVHVPARLRIL